MTDTAIAAAAPVAAPTRATEMVPAPALSGALVFAPHNLAELMSMAKWLSLSKLIPQDLQGRPEDVGIILMWGFELQVSPMQALALIHCIKGRPTCAAELMHALVLRSGACDYWQIVETSATSCTIETLRKRTKAPVQVTWTIEQAKQAGLLQRNPTYAAHPDAMLRARATAALARAVYPDVIRGLYLREEAIEMVEGEGGGWTAQPREAGGNGHSAEPSQTQRALEASLAGQVHEVDPIAAALEAVPAEVER